jgi:anti-anti-sigma regulatory factor
MRYVPFIDMTGLQRLKHIIEILNKKKVFVVLSGVNPEIKKELLKYNVIEEKFIHDNIKSALEFAKTL